MILKRLKILMEIKIWYTKRKLLMKIKIWYFIILFHYLFHFIIMILHKILFIKTPETFNENKNMILHYFIFYFILSLWYFIRYFSLKHRKLWMKIKIWYSKKTPEKSVGTSPGFEFIIALRLLIIPRSPGQPTSPKLWISNFRHI